MPNRFARRIRSGQIASIDELKAEFKSLAKLSHPDLAGPGADHAEFAAHRDEYEAALRDFVRHRFGAARSAARKGSGSASGGAPGDELGEAAGAGDGSGGAGCAPVSAQAWACLSLFLKRGFPKVPRHEKEALRYEYARWRLAEELGREGASLFAACEAELLAVKTSGGQIVAPALALLRQLVDYRSKAVPAMRTEILLSLGALGADPRVGPGYMAFARSLAAELGIGAELPGP
jgi:hypothetical protein